MSAVTTRPTGPQDFDFLYHLHKASMRSYAEETFGPWEDDWQVAYYRKHFVPAETRILQLDGLDIGMIQLQERTEELFLTSIEILPEYQDLGIGSAILKTLLSEAAQRGMPVALQVLKVNRRARDLYQRLGFGVTGENDTHYIMAYIKQ